MTKKTPPDTVTGKVAEAVEQAGLAYQFSPGSYTMSALQSCLAAMAALDGAVVMPKEVADAADVLMGDYLWNDYDEAIKYLRGEDDDAAADKLEAAAELYTRKWLSTHPDEPDETPDLFGETGGEETNVDQHEKNTTMTSRPIFIDYMTDNLGRVYWRERDKLTLHGPFATHEEAQRDSEITVFGPQCAIREGGKLDDVTWKALEESTGATKQ